MAGAKPRPRRLNPELEKLRDEASPPPDINEIITDLTTTPKIHAAYLYTQEGCFLLQTLCRLLSGTKPSYHYAGWEEFGITLGLEPSLIKSIKYSLQLEDPASYILLAYTQKETATIQGIIHVLQEINRHDILLEIKQLVKQLCNTILPKYHENDETKIIRPRIALNCPFILKDLKETNKNFVKPKIIQEKIQKSEPLAYEQKTNQRPYTKTILLTYSSDADEIVQQCLVPLRKLRNNTRLGIVLLNEHTQKLSSYPEQFIFECFAQVDYIFPIITTQYLKCISIDGTALDNCSILQNPDHKYVKYIYRLMNTDYSRNGCKNTKVRCLIPDDTVKHVLKHPIMNHSLFQIWVRIGEIDMLIDNILKLNM